MYPCCRWTSTLAMMAVVSVLAGFGYVYVDRIWNPESTRAAEAETKNPTDETPKQNPKDTPEPKVDPKDKKEPARTIVVEKAPQVTKKDNTPQNTAVPMLGGSPSRNPVNLQARNMPTAWNVEGGKLENIKWEAKIGTRGYAGPTIAGGRIFVPTNNEFKPPMRPDPYKGALMCFRESDGKHLWTKLHSMPPLKIIREGEKDGLCSMPAVDGDFVYYITPIGEVICAKAATGDPVWKYDMMKELGVIPCYLNASSPLIVEGMVFVMTGNGRDEQGNLPAPKAPSFVAFDKMTGKLKWKSNLPGKNIIEGQWASPSYAKVNGQGQVLFPGGDAYLYSFEPKSGKLLWKFHLNPEGEEALFLKESKKIGEPIFPAYPLAPAVIYEGKAYITVGVRPDNDYVAGWGHVWCIDLKKATTFGKTNKDRDVSAKNNNFDPKAEGNTKSALVWHYGGKVIPPPPKNDFNARKIVIGRVLASPCVHDGLVYVPEYAGYLHCLDAKTGKKVWEEDLRREFWSPPSFLDNKLYLSDSRGDILILTAGRKKPKTISTIYMEAGMIAAPVAANGTLYVLSSKKLYAVGPKR
ncbi:MAG: PQQ-binding-like beta-propeller repeat protein [Gemmataceae bacterium]